MDREAPLVAWLSKRLGEQPKPPNRRHVTYWMDDPFGYALSGNTGRDDMPRLATLVYRQGGR